MHVVAARYHLLAPLGAGGAGTVWRAHDAVLHREVAVKQVRLPSDPSLREEALAATLREARAAASLNHPAIITVHDVIAESGQPWIVMDLLAGRSLADLIKEHGRLPAGQVATIGLRVLDALEAAHRHGILHRDVKPGNVLVTDSGEAILTDFGIATHITDATDASPASTAGTPGYIAPERLRGEPAGPASDLWSLAATLFAAVEGRGPYQRDSPMASIAAVLTQPPPPAVNAGPFGELLLRLLNANPATRPHPQVIREILQPVAVPLPTRRPTITTPTVVPAPRRKSRLPLALGGLAVATSLTVTAVLLVNTSAQTTKPPSNQSAAPQPTATTTTAPSQTPRGDGAFATAPHACRLVSDERASKIMPGLSRRQVGLDPTKCDWTAGTFKDVVSIKISHSAQVAVAQKIFTGRKQTQASMKGSKSSTTHQAVRDLPGIGDEAFGQNWWATTFPQAHSVVWVRVSNLVVEIDSADHDRSEVRAGQQERAVETARALADALTEVASTDTG
ncbi:protein kinase [Nonomuraea purpurea]|uniref:non-specific serine/threonine protein kinase n=1 Tax=Nonomuraea purpurea TaxID=1849276 RepID=A0ABV8GAB4_9ACTN